MFLKDQNNKDWKSVEQEKEDKFNEDFEKKLAIEQRKSDKREKNHQLNEIRRTNRYFYNRLEKFTTSKLLMYLIFINCTVIEIYSMWIMYHLSDLSALSTLIGAVIGESLSYAVYCAKSFNDSKEEAKSKLERDKFLSEVSIDVDYPINYEDDGSDVCPDEVM